MNYMKPIRVDEAEGETAKLFEGVTKMLGRVANSFAVIKTSHLNGCEY